MMSQLKEFENAEKTINENDNGDLINLLCEKQQVFVFFQEWVI